jgi:hypothetical protein
MSTEDLDELEFENTRLHTQLALVKLDGVLLNTDRLLAMYNHVSKYGIDRTFLALNNSQNLLDKLCETKFPGCEDILSDYELNKRYFEICMEGLGSAIADAFKWVLEKIKALLSWIGDMWSKFWGLFKNKSDENTKIIAKLRHAALKENAEFEAKYVSSEAVSKFNEIMNKMDQNFKDGKMLVEGTDVSTQTVNQILDYLTTLKFDAYKDNSVVKSIPIKDNNGKTQALNFADQNNKGFSALSVAIGQCIELGRNNAKKLESEQQGLEQAHNAMKDGADKDKVRQHITDIKKSVVRYRKHIDVLSKMLKLVLDGTVLTNKTLKTIGKYCKFATDTENRDNIANEQADVKSQIPTT